MKLLQLPISQKIVRVFITDDSQLPQGQHPAYFSWNISTQVIIPQIQQLQLCEPPNLFWNFTREMILAQHTINTKEISKKQNLQSVSETSLRLCRTTKNLVINLFIAF